MPGLPRWAAGLTVAATLAVLAGVCAGPATAGPAADPGAPTPTAPYPGGPPPGTSPDGSTVGGAELAARGLVLPPGAAALPAGLDARGWLIADLDTDRVLAARDPHGRYYPASTLKTLALLALHDRVDPAAVVTGTAADAGVEGTKVGIVAGGRYPVPLLFQAMMMASGNDAASALSRAAGGVERTLELMNGTASQLQAYDTVAGTPSGLDMAGQGSSAYDLALFMRQIVNDPALLAIVRTPTALMPAVPPRYPAYQIQNQDTLLTTYPGMLAGKNGFTDAARHTFVGAAQRGDRRLVVALMQGEQVPVRMTEQATRLLDWGFALPAGTLPVGELVQPRPLGVPAPTPAAPTIDPPRAGGGVVDPAVAGTGSESTEAAARPAAAGPGVARPPRTLVLVGAGVGSAGLLVLLARLPRGRPRRRSR